MRPNSLNSNRNAQFEGQARALLKDALGWIRGYPLGVTDGTVRWVSLPEIGSGRRAAEQRIGRAELREASYASRRLLRQFPRVLPRLVGNTQRWYSGLTGCLDVLKDVVHRGRPLPSASDLLQGNVFHRGFPGGRASAPEWRQLALRLLETSREWTPMLQALVWLHVRNPRDIRKPLEFLAAAPNYAADWLAVGDAEDGNEHLRVLLHLCDLAAVDGHRRVEGVLSCLVDPRLQRFPLCGPADESLETLKTSLRKLDRSAKPTLEIRAPECTTVTAVKRWIQELPHRSPATRQSALRLFDLINPASVAEPWARVWTELRTLFEDAKRMLADPYEAAPVARAREQLARLDKLRASQPKAYRKIESVLNHINDIVASWDSGMIRDATTILESIPDEPALRAGLLRHWRLMEFYFEKRMLSEWLPAFRGLLKRADNAAHVLSLWHEAIDHNRYWAAPETPLARVPRRSSFEELTRALEAWSTRPPSRAADSEVHDVGLVVCLLRVTQDGRLAGRLATVFEKRQAFKEVSRFSENTLQSLYSLAEQNPDRFLEIACALAPFRRALSNGSSLHGLADLLGSKATVVDALIHAETAKVLSVAARLEVLRVVQSTSGEPCPPPLARIDRDIAARFFIEPHWIQSYPNVLRSELSLLARWDARAERAAAKILGAQFPNLSELRREINALRSRVDAEESTAPALKKRLENLEGRLLHPPVVTARRLENFRRKLVGRAHNSRVDTWANAIESALLKTSPPQLPVSARSSHEKRMFRALRGIAGLSSSWRATAQRVLRARQGPPPWDLRDAPRNRAFLERMTRLGIDVTPWVDGVDHETFTDRTGVALSLALEDDPLEVFLMGDHFRTCLSPFDSNFYAAVANAIDVNKRVLYARNPRGSVQGRCLLALTSRGRLLTFHPYCHDDDERFSAAVAEFAATLARRMGTRCAAHGTVEPLEASGWYDDGPCDLNRHLAIYESGSVFRARLRTLPASGFLQWYEREIAPDPIDETHVSKLLLLEEVHANPALVLALIPAIRSLSLEEHDFARVLLLLRTSGHVDAGTALAVDRMRRVRSGDNADQISDELVRMGEPVLALRMLRMARPRDARRWTEGGTRRLEIAAEAHVDLKRKRTALQLYRELLTRRAPKASKRDWRERTARLEAELAPRHDRGHRSARR